jgi:hypothetical protein
MNDCHAAGFPAETAVLCVNLTVIIDPALAIAAMHKGHPEHAIQLHHTMVLEEGLVGRAIISATLDPAVLNCHRVAVKDRHLMAANVFSAWKVYALRLIARTCSLEWNKESRTVTCVEELPW